MLHCAAMKPSLLAAHTVTLANGLRVVAHEDRSSPLVAVHLMYHVGSSDESPGRTGLAHLLEHLLFEGTAAAPKGTFDELLERVGGSNNGSTWLDRTAYHEVVPSNATEVALWLERDRMANFDAALDEDMLETQREVVLNERLEAYENRPYGLAEERLHQLLFPAAHPYSWPTIGYAADLRAVRVDDVRCFHRRFYTPANAVLVLAGDLGRDEAFALGERYFGDLPSGHPAPRRMPPLPVPRASRGILEDAVTFPRLYRAHALPPFGTRAWVVHDVLAYLLGDGDSARLQRALVRHRQLAQDVDTYLYPTALAGVFGIVATARSGVGADALEHTVDSVLAEAADWVTEAEVTGAIRRARRDQIADLATLEGRAEQLAHVATLLDDTQRLPELLSWYDTVTTDEVREAASGLSAGSGATLTVLPGAA